MAQFHFIEDYERHVADLIANHPLDKAMALAVGGLYEETGALQLAVLRENGLRDGMSIFDLGCGSGRLAHALGKSGLDLDYCGTDIVQALLDYAKSKTPAHYRFARHTALSLPTGDEAIDIACAFSVFTHLLHHESYLYLQDMRRALKPGGRVIFSFLEFAAPTHWIVFENTAKALRAGNPGPLNTFIERPAVEKWAAELGYRIERFIDGTAPIGNLGIFGQSVAILIKD
ncbi:2-methoxy-6-polyprenyl-1,4-benzoquinol methylase, mitochondrial [Paraburkholderia sediminicola]|uniref:2-methoxy-6-polyprenyl-1,4-benzoquinol methylase, mitochondrial n=1 Tax=Paraburkholderia sediminicola TaxID=458836 RepID=A0A6J5B537_9BURK|nr:class I SAM-dependent methyltransferase [Paraburkholderia sediminicola]CAB3691525.1 2-methoxy-6-polyprenyl-1,4-benzoquinol methylase, mitochondrial [Paraburkholderia sediminicola]